MGDNVSFVENIESFVGQNKANLEQRCSLANYLHYFSILTAKQIPPNCLLCETARILEHFQQVWTGDFRGHNYLLYYCVYLSPNPLGLTPTHSEDLLCFTGLC